jgi:GxxExxY protein
MGYYVEMKSSVDSVNDPRSILSREVIGAAIEVHRILGPGLLESAYARCLGRELDLRGIDHRREVEIPVEFKRVRLDCGYRADFVIGRHILVEVKAVEALNPRHTAQTLTYLRLSGLRLGLLLNFHTAVLKSGIRRVVNNY